MKTGLIAIAAMLIVSAPIAAAKDKDADGQVQATTNEALKALQAGDPARALGLVEPVIADFEKQYAGKTRIFCAETPEEGVAYALIGAQGGQSAVTAPGGNETAKPGANIIMGSNWCVAQYIRAFALVDLKRLDEAQAGFERLIQFAPKRSRYLNELGYVLQRKRQWQASIDVYNRADAAADLLAPGDRDYERCVALRGVGYDLVELGQWDEAEAAYRNCLAITPNEPKSLGEIEYINQQRRKTT